ncbi:MAG: DUF2169 domain-containing protein [Polyangia bacterium]|jgi:hypothetical protein
MRLVNQTAVPATVTTSDFEGSTQRIGLLTAKATFRFDSQGRVELETQEPFPLLVQDEKTPLGDLPADLQPRADASLEVIVLGHAYASRERPVSTLTVALTVGKVRRELLVFGNRCWAVDRKIASRPEPFTKMPLTYSRAFGGTVPINLDRESVFDLSDTCNKHGLGFDAERMARELGDLLKAPRGYPLLPAGYVRRLPNLEDPRALITRWEDAPLPMCWATIPIDVPLWVARPARENPKLSPPPPLAEIKREIPVAVNYRAHPDWVIPVPTMAPTIRLDNLLAATPVLEMSMPDFGIVADYTVNGRIGRRSLMPHMLVLLPDQQRFYVVYRLPFNFQFQPGDEREFQLRTEPRWFSGAA